MINQIIVMIAKGKNETTDFVSIKLFDDVHDAMTFVAKFKNDQKDNKSKYWENAKIISEIDSIELNYEFNPNC